MNKMSDNIKNLSRILVESNNGTLSFAFYKDGLFQIEGNTEYLDASQFNRWCYINQLHNVLHLIEPNEDFSPIDNETYLLLKKDFKTPYNSFHSGEYAKPFYWAKKFGKSVDEFIANFNHRNLDDWFRVLN